jgi:hypothetical protein
VRIIDILIAGSEPAAARVRECMIEHKPAVVGGVLVPAWTELRVEE